MKINDILKVKLNEIKLSSEELKNLNSLTKIVLAKLKKQGLKTFVGGSLAKGTIIKKKVQDVDIFVIFKNENELTGFYTKVKKAKLPGKLRLLHGSRDYFQVLLKNNIVIELIPTIKVKTPEDATNVTDVSLFHVNYIKREISKNKRMADEICLAKLFCQVNNCYGAESYIRGFSGYSLEVLVIYFKGFIHFLRKIRRRKIIDPEKHFKNERQVMFELNSSKLISPIIVVDPTYKYRNICAGLGDETFRNFLKVSKDFLKNPGPHFFEKKEANILRLKDTAKKKKGKLYKVSLKTDRQEGSIAGTKCRKFFDFFINNLVRSGQDIIKKEFYYTAGKTAVGYLIIKENKVIEYKGPPLKMQEEVLLFKKKNKNTFVKKDSIYARKKVRIFDIFKKANKVKKEMGAWSEKIELVK